MLSEMKENLKAIIRYAFQPSSYATELIDSAVKVLLQQSLHAVHSMLYSVKRAVCSANEGFDCIRGRLKCEYWIIASRYSFIFEYRI